MNADAIKVVALILVVGAVVLVYKFTESVIQAGKKAVKQNPTFNAANDYVKMNQSKIKKKVKKEINYNYLTSCTWRLYTKDEVVNYIFRSNGELLISKEGGVKRASYEFIIDSNSILIERKGKSSLWNIVNSKNDFLFLNKVSTNEVMYFYNQTKIMDEVKNAIKEHQKQYLLI